MGWPYTMPGYKQKREAKKIGAISEKLNIFKFQTLEELWKPNLEIYGLEVTRYSWPLIGPLKEFTNHKILGAMAGLRITKNKWVKYDTK